MKTRITRHSLLCGALLMLGLLTSACSDDPKAEPTPAPICEAGSLDCECYANETCDEGLACVDSVCATDDDPNPDPNPGPNPDPNPDPEPGVPTGLGLSVLDANARACEAVLIDAEEKIERLVHTDTQGQMLRRGERLAVAFHAQSDGAIDDGGVDFALADGASSLEGIGLTAVRCFDTDGNLIDGAGLELKDRR